MKKTEYRKIQQHLSHGIDGVPGSLAFDKQSNFEKHVRRKASPEYPGPIVLVIENLKQRSCTMSTPVFLCISIFNVRAKDRQSPPNDISVGLTLTCGHICAFDR